MTGRDLLREVVTILAPLAKVGPGLAGMTTVNGVPMLRVSGDRLVLLALVAGTSRIDARTVEPHERPERIAAEVLTRYEMSRPVAA